MEEVPELVEVAGWGLTRAAGASVSGSARLKAAEALARFAEAEKFRAAAMLHDEAQHAVDPRLEALENRRGMQISMRTGRIMSYAATQSAVMEIALVQGLSQGQAHRVLEQAETLVMDTPEVLESMALGRIGTSHVQRILEHTQHIIPDPLPLPRKEADEATKEEWEREVAQRAAKARADRRDFGADMLALAPGKSPSQLRARGRQVLEKYYGHTFTKRSRTALRDRRITLEEARDGMTWFSGYLPTASCQAIFSKIDAMARLLKSDPDSAAAVSRAAAQERGETMADPEPDPAETRTMDQLRADVFTDMVPNGPRGQGLEAVNAEVYVAIPATMLPGTPGGPTSTDHTPSDGTGPGSASADHTAAKPPTGTVAVATAELPPGAPVPTLLGGGPIDQDSAARLMNAAKTWWRLVTDPITGAVVTFGQKRYRPTAAQRAALQFRDGGCTTPGCTGPARHCEADHTNEWQDGGGTDIANIQLRCRRCHRMKSLGLIEVEQRAGGTVLVTSLFGTRKTSYPAAPWAVADPGKATAAAPSAGSEPPPPDPDAAIPSVEPTCYLPPRPADGTSTDDFDDDDDPGMTEAEYDAWTAQMLREADPQAADHLAERAAADTGTDDFPEDEQHSEDPATEPPPRPYDPLDEKPECGHYQQMQAREWGKIQDVPDSSVENPDHGRYARSRNGKATRKRRLKRNAGEYGPRRIERPGEHEYPFGTEPDAPPEPPAEPPF
ncbi:DUF222 domain-containing protein [Arthrobacter sp. JSM 101049]|uniref:HNH endonuclease signature motif containing protein n=1 Tax=Arthrobacter sp. JSM 101049 TaxID=929097 RepID=UPI0035635837